jgi:hypothetical protein
MTKDNDQHKDSDTGGVAEPRGTAGVPVRTPRLRQRF